MAKYALKRLLSLFPVLLGVSLLAFALTRFGPVDPAVMMLGNEATNAEVLKMQQVLGLDKPLPIQYLLWLGNVLSGNLGRSYLYGSSVSQEIADRFPATLILALSGVAVTIAVSLPLGILSAVKRGKVVDQLSMLVTLLGLSTPTFLLGFLFLWFLSFKLPLFPTTGMDEPLSIVLPALTIGLPSAAVVTRLTRTSMLEVLNQDYVRTAQAKGLKQRLVITRHCLKNALIPIVTVVGLQFGHLLSGSLIVEQVFAWPGLGRLMVNAVSLGDFPVIQGTTLVFTVIFVGINLGVDLLYGVSDPRISVGG